MPPTLPQILPIAQPAQGSNREAAEHEITARLQNKEARQVSDLVRELSYDETTVLRAIFRLAASGQVILDKNLNISLAE